MAIRITGQVVNRSSGTPVLRATVEGLIKVRNDAAQFASTNTSRGGRFQMDLEERQWEQFLTADPETFIFFRVFLAGIKEPVANTRDTMRWKPGAADDIRIEIDNPLMRNVRGTIWTAEGRPANAVIVHARAKQPDGQGILLGTATTSDTGNYVIAYPIDLLPAERQQFADIYLQVFADQQATKLLGTSSVFENAPADIVIDLVLTSLRSEYEEDLAELEPLLSTRVLHELNEKDIAELSNQTGIPKDRIAMLVSAARFAHEASIDTVVFYSLIRLGVADSWEKILVQSEERLREALNKAHDAGIVPRLDPTQLDAAMDQWRRVQNQRAPLAQLADKIGLEPEHPVFRRLDKLNIKTLLDVRNTGGLQFVKSLEVAPDDPAIQKLDAHARLSTLNSDVAANEDLISKGYSSISAIAQATPDEIAQVIGSARAAVLHDIAKSQTAVVQNVALTFAANTATGHIQSIEDWKADHPIHQVLPESCGCKDCEAAVSPRAYLADLMQYAIDHLRDNGVKIDLDFFKTNFHQPFSELPANCAAQDEQVRQVRICIEVLRSYLGQRPLTPAARETSLKQAEQEYLLNAYQRLLTKLGTSFTEIRLARGGSIETRKQIAERIGISVGALPSLFLDPGSNPPQLTEAALERLFGLADTTQPPHRQKPVPAMQTWRLEFLRGVWKTQDWPNDDYSEKKLPVVDPDLLGPDDFRQPFGKTNVNDSDKAFDLWVNRRSWADGLIKTLKSVALRQDAATNTSGPDFQGIVNAMAFPYKGQAPLWPAGALVEIRDKLAAMTSENATATAQELYNSYRLHLDAARRLIELWEKDNVFWIWKNPQRVPKLTPEEWEDLYSIILRAQKNELRRFWTQEEQESVLMRLQAGELRKVWLQDDDTSQVLLGPREFWKPLRKPVEGDWPPERVAGIPLIDPEKIKRQDLPDPTAGQRALQLWDRRFEILDNKRKSLKTNLETSTFTNMVTEAIGPVPPGAASWVDYLRALVSDLSSTTPATAETAKTTIERSLRFTIEGFQRLVTVMENHVSAGAKAIPSKADWTEVFALLTSAWKERTLYSGWYADEIDANSGIEPWRCLRHSLHKWRATAQERQGWDRALERKNKTPVIDPDMLASTAYFKTPGFGDAWTLWDQRRRAIDVKVQLLRGQGGGANRNATTLAAIADAELGNGVLQELVAAKQAGRGIAVRLEQVSLSFDTLNELLRVRELLNATPPQAVLNSEWDSICSILTQVWKRRQFADWQLEERTKGLSLSPDLFQLLPIDLTQFPPQPPPRLDPWRGSPTLLLDWQDKLQSRIDQDQEMIAGIAGAVSEVEEQTLPALRDALVVAAHPQGLSSTPAGRWLGDHLAIATEYDGCHLITRITQAIETFQIILWGVRTGTLSDIYPNLKLVAPAFDEEWKWIGSYASWRAAMFVFLYPENILLPSLRRVQSPGFRRLVDELRGIRKLTPARAREVAEHYAAYFRDICSLTLRAKHDIRVKPGAVERTISFLFGQSSNTGTLYWSILDSAGLPDYPQSFWDQITALKSVRSVVGTATYRTAGSKNLLYLFAITSKEGRDELSFIKYDLNQYGKYDWPEDAIKLTSPPNAATFEAVALIPRQSETTPLGVRIRLPNGAIYERSLNVEGDDWDSGEWKAMDRYWSPWIRSGVGINQFRPETALTVFTDSDTNMARLLAVRNDGVVCVARWNNYLLNPTTKLQAFQPVRPAQQPQFSPTADMALMGRAADENANEKLLLITDKVGSPWEISWSLQNGWLSWRPTGGHGGWGGQPATFTTGPNMSPKVVRLSPKRSMQFLMRDPATFLDSSTGFDPESSWVSWWDGTTGAFMQWFNTHDRRKNAGGDREPVWPASTLTSMVTRQRGMADLFVLGEDRLIYFTNYNEAVSPAVWTPWTVVPNSSVPVGSSIASAVNNPTALELFFVNSEGSCRSARFSTKEAENDGWTNWIEVSGGGVRLKVDCPITAVTVREDRVVLFGIGRDSKLYTSWRSPSFEEGKWQPWVPVGNRALPEEAKRIAVISRGGDSRDETKQLIAFAVGESGEIVWSESSQHWNPLAEPWLNAFVWKPIGAELSTLTITDQVTDAERSVRQEKIKQSYLGHWSAYKSTTAYLEEAFYFVPLHLSLQLQKSGAFIAALDWLRLVFDYTLPSAQRQLVGLGPEPANADTAYQRKIENWLLDPLNPHSIAETRAKTYTRYTRLSIIKCLLDYADSEFTQDTSESVPRARELYEAVLELLDAPELRQSKQTCDQIIGDLSIAVNDPHWEWIGPNIRNTLKKISKASDLGEAIEKITPILASATPAAQKYAALQPILSQIDEKNEEVLPVGQVVTDAFPMALQLESAVLSKAEVAGAMESLLGSHTLIEQNRFASSLTGVPTFANFEEVLPAEVRQRESPQSVLKATSVFNFCVPPNPVLRSLRLRADLNLYKIRNCLNIAGMHRQLESFAAPTDTISGMPTIGGDGQLVLPGLRQIQVTGYRYAVLIERAKQLAQHAVQVESAFLSSLEKSDKEAFDLISARANLRLAQAGVRLQDLRVLEAEDGIKLAELQRDRSNILAKTYEDWIDIGMLAHEQALLAMYDYLAIAQIISVGLGAIMQGITGGLDIGPVVAAQIAYQAANAGKGIAESFAIDIQRNINRLNVQISHDLRMREWSLQKSLADQDARIGEEQIHLANDRVRVVEQERTIEQMKSDHAREVLDFLTNKFTNKDLYDWMSGILERVYSFFLQQATSMAQVASDQLAFERQEAPPRYIQGDYWEGPSEDSDSTGSGTRAPDRRGLTGSARLLQDIYQLDQYAFEKNQRKQQLTKTISLAQLDPLVFQRFRETGVLPFTTPTELFDRDFPGHYLRLTKRVRTTVVALVPPTQGIRATLTSSGVSRVVIGGDMFQTTVVRRPPETVALSATFNATGLFELQEQPEMLLPFEGQGVATSWEFVLPKAANQFDYSTIADVLLTIEYTALNDFNYRQQVVQLLNANRTTSADRAFSFRQQFADAWYDLNNPEPTVSPMSVGFQTTLEDFPPNLDNLRIENISLYIARSVGTNTDFESVDLSLEQPGGGSLGGVCRTENGLISTRSAAGSGWLALRDSVPVGNWRLALPHTEQTTQWFKDGDIEDIMFVITYAGRLPEWPL